jgi:dTMP kinase
VHPDLQPDITWLFDVPLEVARERLNRTRDKDRFEQEADAFFLRTRQVYLERASQQAHRFRVVDSTQPIDVIRVQLNRELVRLFDTGSAR